MDQKKIKSYFGYALGEIILVVIGVLIAIGINNLNQQRKDKDQSKTYLEYMVKDLSEDIRYLDNMLVDLNVQLAYEEWLLNQTQFNKSHADSVITALSDINWKFYINDRSFQNIQNNEGIKLVGFQELYPEISQYYIVTSKRIAASNEIENQAALLDNYYDLRLNGLVFLKPRQYSDYSGFKVDVNIDLKEQLGGENYVGLISQLEKVQIKNHLHDKYSRHNYNYLVLSMANIHAKQLKASIEKAISN